MTDELATTQEPRWDFFIAHAGDDLNVAKNLKQKLDPPAKVFLDKDDLLLGGEFDLDLPAAQKSSLISIVIVSPKTRQAHYQREEIAAAIQLAREDPYTHRVVPVYIDAKLIPPAEMPYGLRLKHSFYIPESGDFAEAGRLLLKTLQYMKQREAKKVEVVAEHRKAIAKIESGGKADLFAGLSETAGPFRPFLKVLQGLFVLTAVLLIVCLLPLPLFDHDERRLAAIGLGCFGALLLFGIIKITMLSVSYSKQIALGNINGG